MNAAEPQFEAGQVWSYRTRPGEEASRVIVGRVEPDAQVGTAVHVRIVGVAVKNPIAPGGRSLEIGHIPIAASALERSVVARLYETPDLTGFEEGYQTWRESVEDGAGGIFTEPVADIVAFVEQAINREPG